ncbi:alpha/beta-Hydrolases superfamily protein [Rhynchospora pubera]|uniref:Alpha/beta-Hydrolases superfamily protein n=1 Tax=Rhynchospora pubera TaxID=906938 RepID=A0AAV8FTR0_9POAL|nr:alpha/beta-Hydrolases superfamily protein [Rhynchospora pubera]
MGIGLSLVPVVDFFAERRFRSAGLQPYTIPVDHETTVACWLSQAPKQPPSLPPLVLIHGFGPRSTWQWRCQVGSLSRHFSLIVPDLVFFGGSTSTSPLRSEAFQADAIARLLEHLGLDDQPVSVVGTSYGGFVAYHLARALGPSRVDKVVIASSDLLKGEADDQALRNRGNVESVAELLLPKEAEKVRTALNLAMYQPPRYIPDFVIRDMIQNLYKDKIEEKMELIKGSTIGKENFELTPIPQDVLIIWGEHDQIFPLDKAHEVKRILGEKSEKVNLEIMQKTGHMPQTEDPTRFNQILLDFLLNK